MKCPNCGDNIVFDAESQLLVCKSCDSKFKVKNKTKTQSAEERTEGREEIKETPQEDAGISLTRFGCSSCGAELAGTYENSALGFCPYCGSESILTSRLTAKRPDRIIPFSKTKKDCHEEYLGMVSKMPFVPSELKKDEFISEIRGIYIPYNIYHTRHKGQVYAEYGDSHGNVTDYYSLSGDIDASVYVPVDASVQLDDSIGTFLFPYSPSSEKPFEEGYLATNYVELPDIKVATYKESLKEETMQAELRALKYYSEDNDCTLKDESEKENIKATGVKTVLSPAYFLTYRNNDRVCYTVIPGTKDGGTAYSEVPVDIKKYTVVVIVLSVIVWALLTYLPFIPTLKHTAAMGIMCILAAFAMVLQRSSYGRQKERGEIFGQKRIEMTAMKMAGKAKGNMEVLKLVGVIGITFYVSITALASGAFELPAIAIALAALLSSRKIHKQYPQINIRMSYIMFGFTTLMGAVTFISRHVFFPDEVVYPLMGIIAAPVTLCFFTLIKTFNDSCSRPLPHFKRQGGHNSAKDL